MPEAGDRKGMAMNEANDRTCRKHIFARQRRRSSKGNGMDRAERNGQVQYYNYKTNQKHAVLEQIGVRIPTKQQNTQVISSRIIEGHLFTEEIVLESYVLERHTSSFSTETYKYTIRAHTYTHHILTDTRKNKWTQDNNITSIIAYTYKNNEREREWQNANASMDLFVYRHNQKHLLTNTHKHTHI